MIEPTDEQTPSTAPLPEAANAFDDPDVGPDREDPPPWVQQRSLAEILLWRLGVPTDRKRMEEEHRAATPIDLAPPLTTKKVVDAIANLSLLVIHGQLDPSEAKTSLYALQTLLSALRLQLTQNIEPRQPGRPKKKPEPKPIDPKPKAGSRKAKKPERKPPYGTRKH